MLPFLPKVAAADEGVFFNTPASCSALKRPSLRRYLFSVMHPAIKIDNLKSIHFDDAVQ